MAVFFPFDETLVGYQEVVTVKTADLTIPIFVFPKGSFFVENTYAVIKGTNTILRPGLDYLVLSCNEGVAFSSNATLETKLKQAYVRTAVLLRTSTAMELEWHIAYCGGEETTKKAEYDNYLNQLYNQARNLGTVNLMTTPHQAWAGLLNVDNSQIMSGKHIYSKPFRVIEETEIGEGLGWGKVELAIQAIAESVTLGGDNGVIDAFFNWAKHNEIEFNKAKNKLETDLNTKIQALDGKRIEVGQFMFREEAVVSGPMHFAEHNNVMLRGLDPNQPGIYINSPTETNRNDVGFFGLAASGFDINALSAKLYQRTANAPTNKVRFGVVFDKAVYNAGTIQYSVLKDIGVVSGTQTLYVVSKQLGVIHTRDITATLNNSATTRTAFSFGYTTTNVDYSLDTLFAYVLDSNMQGDFTWVGNAKVIINNVRHAFTLDVINRGNMLGPDLTEAVDQVTPQFELVVKRTYSINATTIALRAKIAETNALVSINALSAINVSFAAGESEKRILVNLTNAAQITDKQIVMFYLGTTANIITSVLVGLKGVGRQDYAQISLLDYQRLPISAIDVNRVYTLQVQFSKDADYFIDDLNLSLTKLLGTTANASLGTKNVVSNSVIEYPISFSGSLDAIVSLGLLDQNNANFKTNKLNVAYSTNVSISESTLFSPIVVGKHLKISRQGDQYLLDFAIAVKDSTVGGYVFDLSSTNANLTLPTSVISSQGLVRFRSTIPVNKLVSGTSRLNFVKAGQTFPLNFTVNLSRLIAIEIEYRDGGYSSKTLETDRAFRIMMTNPFEDRKLELTRDSFPIELGITDIVYGAGLTDIVVANLTLLPGERKQITVGDWVSIEEIETSTALVTRYAPNCSISQVLVANGNTAKTSSYLTEVGEILFNKEDYEVQAINVLTGNAIYDYGMVDNFIDVVTQFEMSISDVTSAIVTVSSEFNVTVRNIILSPIDKTIIVALTLSKKDDTSIYPNNIIIGIDFINASSQLVHKVTTSVTGK